MRTRTWIVALALVAFCGLPALAQNKAAVAVAPQLSELDGLKIENLLLKQKIQKDLYDKITAEFQALLGSLQKPGYQIGQLPDGKLGYVPEPTAAEKK